MKAVTLLSPATLISGRLGQTWWAPLNLPTMVVVVVVLVVVVMGLGLSKILKLLSLHVDRSVVSGI